ncbi:hypothetical protein E4U11_000172 [Claviceps purpurea]|nr:hypothetical protein E4U11_000172 [Claviceps purpurea]
MASRNQSIFFILNPPGPGEFPRQMPRAPLINVQDHVTETQISPHAGLESAESQSVPQMEWQSDATQLPTIDPSNTRPLEELEYSVLSAIPGVDIPLETKLGTKEAQERRNRNASSSRQSRDNKRLIKARAELIKKQKEMKQELEEEREKRLAAEETARQERERSRQKDAENERLKRQVEELRQSK